MKQIFRKIAGIDVDQKLLVSTFGEVYYDGTEAVVGFKTFANTSAGFEALLSHCLKLFKTMDNVRFVFEATGVYHEKLAYFLADKGLNLSIVKPTKIANFAKTLDVKTVTDKTSSEAIMKFGLSRSLENWQRPNSIYRDLKQLTRERTQVVAARTVAKNQLHAEKVSAYPSAKCTKRLNDLITLLNKQEKQINKELILMIAKDKVIAAEVANVCTAPGVAMLTAVTVIAEMDGFNLIENCRQLTSFVGLDVKQKQSGTSVKGKQRISKQGNKYVRSCLHYPALSAVRSNKKYKKIQEAIYTRTGIKMKGYVAVQRRILELIYVLVKTKSVFDPNFEAKKIKEGKLQTA